MKTSSTLRAILAVVTMVLLSACVPSSPLVLVQTPTLTSEPTPIPTLTRTPVPSATPSPISIPVYDGVLVQEVKDQKFKYIDTTCKYEITLPSDWRSNTDEEASGIFIPRLIAELYAPDSSLLSILYLMKVDIPNNLKSKSVDELTQNYVDTLTTDEELISTEVIKTKNGVTVSITNTVKKDTPYFQRTIFFKSEDCFNQMWFDTLQEYTKRVDPLFDEIVESIELTQ